MRRTSILLEFSDEVYDTLVEPLKKNKSFTKLVTTLIDGYLNDAYVRAYADDTLDSMRNQAVSSFNDSIASMNETLSEMGLVTDELESNAVGGKAMFAKKAQEQSDELSKGSVGKNKDIAEVNERIDKMQDSIQGMMSLLVEMLKSGNAPTQFAAGVSANTSVVVEEVLSKPSVKVEEPKVPAVEETKNDVAESLVTNSAESAVTEKSTEEVSTDAHSEEVTSDSDTSVSNNEEETSSEEAEEANNFLASMLMGNSYEF